MSFKEGGGYFFEYITKDLTTIIPVFLNHVKYWISRRTNYVKIFST